MDNINKKESWKNRFVSWKIFAWTISIIIMLFGIVFSSMVPINKKLDDHTKEYNKIQVQLSQIQTDLVWIKNQLD